MRKILNTYNDLGVSIASKVEVENQIHTIHLARLISNISSHDPIMLAEKGY